MADERETNEFLTRCAKALWNNMYPETPWEDETNQHLHKVYRRRVLAVLREVIHELERGGRVAFVQTLRKAIGGGTEGGE